VRRRNATPAAYRATRSASSRLLSACAVFVRIRLLLRSNSSAASLPHHTTTNQQLARVLPPVLFDHLDHLLEKLQIISVFIRSCGHYEKLQETREEATRNLRKQTNSPLHATSQPKIERKKSSTFPRGKTQPSSPCRYVAARLAWIDWAITWAHSLIASSSLLYSISWHTNIHSFLNCCHNTKKDNTYSPDVKQHLPQQLHSTRRHVRKQQPPRRVHLRDSHTHISTSIWSAEQKKQGQSAFFPRP